MPSVRAAFAAQQANPSITTIYFPSGRYLLNLTERVPPYEFLDGIGLSKTVTVVGDGIGTSVLKAGPQMVIKNFFLFNTGINHASIDVIFQHLTIEGPDDEWYGNWCLEQEDPLDRCTIWNGRTTAAFSMGNNGLMRIEDVSITQFTAAFQNNSPPVISDYCNGGVITQIVDSYIMGNGAMGVLQDCGTVFIRNSHFRYNGLPKGATLWSTLGLGTRLHAGNHDHHLYLGFGALIDIDGTEFDNNFGNALQIFGGTRYHDSSRSDQLVRITNSTFGINQRNGVLTSLFHPTIINGNTFKSQVTNYLGVIDNKALRPVASPYLTANGNRFSNSGDAIHIDEGRICTDGICGGPGEIGSSFFDGPGQQVALFSNSPSTRWTVTNSKFKGPTTTVVRSAGAIIDYSSNTNIFNWAGDSNSPSALSPVTPDAPVVYPVGGTYSSSVSVRVWEADNAPNGETHYTTDGSEPTPASKLVYETIRVNVGATTTTTLKVRTFKNCFGTQTLANFGGRTSCTVAGTTRTETYVKGTPSGLNPYPFPIPLATPTSTSPPTPTPTPTPTATPTPTGTPFTGAVLVDNFNDNTVDTSKWRLGTLNDAPAAYDALIPVLERNQRLEITPRSGLDGFRYNGYVSIAGWDYTGSQASVEVVQTTTVNSSADTIFAIGIDSNNWCRFVEENGLLYFQQKVAGLKSSTSQPYNATQHHFWRFRHDPVQDAIIFETSVNGGVWVMQRVVTRGFAINSLRAELDAGTASPAANAGTAVFDNFILESNNPPRVSTPLLLTESNSLKAIALHSVTWLGGPFSLFSDGKFGADPRNRIALFGVLPGLTAADDASAVTVQLVDSQNRTYSAPVEFIGPVPSLDWLTEIIVPLPTNLPASGDVSVTITFRNQTSNQALITIGNRN